MSKLGTVTAPAAPFLVAEEEPEVAVPEAAPVAVPVATAVTVPVPADPAALTRELQELLEEPDWVLPLPLKSQAVEALFCAR